MRHRGLLIIIAALLAITVQPVALPVALGQGQATAQISLNPSQGSPGTTVTVTGSGWPGTQVVDVNWDGNFVTEGQTDTNGAFSAQFNVPGNATTGAHTVTGLGGAPQVTATATFTVSAPSVSKRNVLSDLLTQVRAWIRAPWDSLTRDQQLCIRGHFDACMRTEAFQAAKQALSPKQWLWVIKVFRDQFCAQYPHTWVCKFKW